MMMTSVLVRVVACALMLAAGAAQAVPAVPAASVSAYPAMPVDPRAVVVRATGDGATDDSAAIQAALDQAANGGQGGLVFLPSGRYRITRSLLIPLAVRLYGVGPTRPVLLLAPGTPGFQKGVANMVIFTGGDQYQVGKVPVPVPSAVPFSEKVRDANSSTFYSALSNVDFEIKDGNPAAAAVRMHTAQHSNLSHIDFHIGTGLAGVYQVGNLAYNLRFYGGRYGILAEKTSPAWQFTLMDSRFEGQRDAAIREHEAGLTMVNVDIRDTPVGIEIDRGYGDWLWGKDVRFENVGKAALIVSNEDNVYTQVGLQNASARNVPTFVRFRDSGRTLAGKGRDYRVTEFNYGLFVDRMGEPGRFATSYKTAALPAATAPARALRPLPSSREWANVLDFGARGDGVTDDTAAIQKALDTHRTVYLPLGFYVVNDTIRMRPDTVIVALHPGLTQLLIPNGSPAFQGLGTPKALLESARGGDAIVSGIGLATGEVNNRAVALLWRAGAQSLVDDVRIQGGHGTRLYDGSRADPYRKDAKFDTTAHWDRQYPSVWVTDGGGGTFSGIWSPSGYAQAGFYVTDTTTPGKVYQLSAEHHVRAEIVLDRVQNWEFLAPQTEEEIRDGADAVSLEIRNSKNLLFANYHGYRVTRSTKPMPAAVLITNSSDIRFRNVHVNGESGYATCDENGCATYLRASRFAYENAIRDVGTRLEVREREFAVFDYNGRQRSAPAPQGKVVKLAGGFHALGGAAVDAAGKLYVVDRHWKRIFSWTKDDGLVVVHDAPLDPVNLAIDASGNVMVLSSYGPQASVYAFRPDAPAAGITPIAPTPVMRRKGARVAVPVNFWQNGEFRDQLDVDTHEFTTLAEMFARDVALPKANEYVSPDASLVLPAYRVLRQGAPDHLGWRWADSLQAHGFVSAPVGQRVVFTNSSENRTYSGVVNEGGGLTDLTLLAKRGGESAALAPNGDLYVANGQVFIHDRNGKPKGRFDVPERPLQLIFGGPGKRTLFILGHHTLYAAQVD